jgi:hypothetical protein
LDSDDGAEVPANMQKAKDIEFERNEKGVLRLPPNSDFKTIRAKQRVVRGYVGAVYSQSIHLKVFLKFSFFLKRRIGDFTGNSRAGFPYLIASKRGQKIFSPDSVPKGFILSDPDHLKAYKINELYNHWLTRQSKGLSPFIVLNSIPHHGVAPKKSGDGKGKKKAEWVDVGTDDDDEGSKSSGDDEKNQNPFETEVDSDEGQISPDAKFGPPRTVAKKTTSSATQKNETPAKVAGPSKLPSLDNLLKSKTNEAPKLGEVAAEKSTRSKSKLKVHDP